MGLPAVRQAEAKVLFDIKLDQTDLGGANSFRRHVLTCVLAERYDEAIEGLKDFLDGESPYPDFKGKVSRFVTHSIDLIYAIKAKKSFPGISSLTRAKQQELREKFKEHFRELQQVLKIIEKIETDLRIADVRSTVYVVKALWIAGVAIIALAFWLEVVNGLAVTSSTVFDDSFTRAIDWLWALCGFK